APIVPLIPTATRKAELRSWDRFQIPLPLARCTLEVGDPIFVQEMTDEEATAALAAALAKSTEPADEREPDRTRSLDDDRDAADAQGASGDPTPSRA
ncbi:MAG TPA: hypothetical protein VK116_04275, partial [Planctomycetota bacterium]|nr:hypothetical protein [Planctomycetota bacterium]